ncbi:MAG: hypothetical protein MJ237_02645 [bacterium]|nr:hypothetical protein [bacterium]
MPHIVLPTYLPSIPIAFPPVADKLAGQEVLTKVKKNNDRSLLIKTIQEYVFTVDSTDKFPQIASLDQLKKISNYLSRKTNNNKNRTEPIMHYAYSTCMRALSILSESIKNGLKVINLTPIAKIIIDTAVEREVCNKEIDKITQEAINTNQSEYTQEQLDRYNKLVKKFNRLEAKRIRYIDKLERCKKYNQEVTKKADVYYAYSLFYEYNPKEDESFPEKAFD